jgi:hypothetical protein
MYCVGCLESKNSISYNVVGRRGGERASDSGRCGSSARERGADVTGGSCPGGITCSGSVNGRAARGPRRCGVYREPGFTYKILVLEFLDLFLRNRQFAYLVEHLFAFIWSEASSFQ